MGCAGRVPAAGKSTSMALALIQPACDRAEGQAHAATGDRTAAEALLRQALAGFQRMGVVFEAALTSEQLAAIALDRDTARLLGNQALAIYEQLHAIPHAERLRAATSTPLGQP
jgi:hypothetical protein